RLARDQGLDISTLTGSGPAGVILRRDVDAAAARSGALVDNRRVAPQLHDRRPGVGERWRGETQRVPLRGVRRAIAEKMARSRREIPEVTTWVDVVASGLVEAREALRRAHPEVGLMALLARF